MAAETRTCFFPRRNGRTDSPKALSMVSSGRRRKKRYTVL
jgi:hypothetical protein